MILCILFIIFNIIFLACVFFQLYVFVSVFPSTVDIRSAPGIDDAYSSYLMAFCYSRIFFVLQGNICMLG